MGLDLSIIVTCYNKEKYIERCINSIISQINESVEVIVIDDGSTDNSLSLLNKIKTKALKIISLENSGISNARNRGIEESIGRYIWFIDGDDYIEKNALNIIISKINEGYDIIWFNHKVKTYKGIKHKEFFKKKEITKNDLIECSEVFVWDKIIRKDIIGDKRFNCRIGILEDLIFIIEIIIYIEKIYVISKPLYVYECTNETSIQYYRSKRHLLKRSYESKIAQFYLKGIISDIENKELKNVLTRKLTFSCCGHIYSLLRFYNCRILKRTLAQYKKEKLYPFAYTGNLKMNLFAFVINNKTLWHLFPLLKRIRNI